jgi:hypothetical protein
MVITEMRGRDLSIRGGILCESGGRPSSAAYAVIRQAVRFLQGKETRFTEELLIKFLHEDREYSIELHPRCTWETVKDLHPQGLAGALQRFIPEGLGGSCNR